MCHHQIPLLSWDGQMLKSHTQLLKTRQPDTLQIVSEQLLKKPQGNNFEENFNRFINFVFLHILLCYLFLYWFQYSVLLLRFHIFSTITLCYSNHQWKELAWGCLKGTVENKCLSNSLKDKTLFIKIVFLLQCSWML